MITNFNAIDKGSESHHDASTFMSADEGKLGRQWPISVHCVKICMANARIFYVDENLIWTWLLNWNLLVDKS
jgi:hypothetical protein